MLQNRITGRCYCGAVTISASIAPQMVAYCHCADCRRATGAPVAAFAAFDEKAVQFLPDSGQRISVAPGVERSFCGKCGSPLSGRYEYLPGQVYVPLGLLDQANEFAPQCHAHEGERLAWLHISDGVPRFDRSARSALREPGK